MCFQCICKYFIDVILMETGFILLINELQLSLWYTFKSKLQSNHNSLQFLAWVDTINSCHVRTQITTGIWSAFPVKYFCVCQRLRALVFSVLNHQNCKENMLIPHKLPIYLTSLFYDCFYMLIYTRFYIYLINLFLVASSFHLPTGNPSECFLSQHPVIVRSFVFNGLIYVFCFCFIFVLFFLLVF